ncbi:hypothetical protein QR98_0057040 [Sarcoptes scabiei]|uniref:Uncharacterized protein n=1 Tax=Sarcoptes scabiei TaxID=52283 RepID=A0A132A8B6_SARSC|nr:hypothetical protein QR98_0057040 [Sarcoptes scabiei]
MYPKCAWNVTMSCIENYDQKEKKNCHFGSQFSIECVRRNTNTDTDIHTHKEPYSFMTRC